MRRSIVLARPLGFALCAAALAPACLGKSSDREKPEHVAMAVSESAQAPASGGAGSGAPGAMDEMKKEEDRPADGMDRAAAIEQAQAAGVLGSTTLKGGGAFASLVGNAKTPAQAAPEAPTRAWFPETFLFQPLVVTDDGGAATVPVRVPDRLTTWRVLALGHSRGGAQGGAVTSFLGTLPVYVDPVIPPFLVAGDEIRLPVQLVNTTAEAAAAELAIDLEGTAEGGAVGATLTAARGARRIPAQGSLVEYATLKAARPGPIKLRVGLGGADAVVRTIDVQPVGRPIITTRSGTLAAPRTLSIEGPAGADAATDRVRLMVFPGALALLRSELAVSTARAGLAEDAYALLLAGRAPALLTALGDKADPEALRELAIVAGQRAVRHARRLDVAAASVLAPAALAHPGSPVLERLGERAAALLAREQRPDGTFGGGQGWTLQRVLVATADGVRAVAAAGGSPTGRQRAQAAAFRAAGAFERNADAVPDAYTAAAILASGALAPGGGASSGASSSGASSSGVMTGPLADKLRVRVRDGVAGDAGGKWLAVGEGVVRADGTVPGRAEATALAVLALEGDPKAAALRADLGATLLGSYTPAHGWGDGRTNLACMQAVLALFANAQLPATVQIALSLDGKQVASGTFDRARLRDVLVLEGLAGASVAGAHEWRITAEPAVPGLGYALALHSFVPWERAPVRGGLELQLPAAVEATVGKPAEITLTAVAPSGMALHITHALPAGVQADRPSLDALVSSGLLSRFEVADGKIDLYAPALDPGEVLSAKYRLIPTFAGRLHSGPILMRAGIHEVYVPPTEWTVR